MDTLKIALLGTRGIPARYGGFETFAEELSTRLVQRGHEVTVFCRRQFGRRFEGPQYYRGVRLRAAPTLMHKYLETPLHSLSSFLSIAGGEFDIALLCNAANSPFAWIAGRRGLPLLVNVDGVERRRSKWNRLGRLWYRIGERCSVLFADRVIADADVIADYYLEHHRTTCEVIAYGAEPTVRPPGAALAEFGLTAGRYLLYVSRLEPENNALGVIEAYSRVNTDLPLVVVGGAPYAKKYIQSLRDAAGPGVVFTGFQFGEVYQELRTNCFLYLQASEVGGTHPALLEGMAYGNCVVANDVPEHREVLADCGAYYGFNDFTHLSALLQDLISRPEQVQAYGLKAQERARRLYRWDGICDQYEDLFYRTLGRSRSGRSGPAVPPVQALG